MVTIVIRILKNTLKLQRGERYESYADVLGVRISFGIVVMGGKLLYWR
jgi:hypothetical protein